MASRELLEKADKKIFKLRLVDPDCLLSNIIPKKKETKYQLRNKSAHRPDISVESCTLTDKRFKYNNYW